MPQNTDTPSDAELARAVCEGRTEAYDLLVGRHLKSVYAVAVRIVHDRTEAEDVVQDTFIRAFERLYLYDIEHSFRNWLLKIATNLSINRLRSRRRERILKLNLAEKTQQAKPEPAAEIPAAREWQYWLDQLDESQRTAIVLFHFHQMPYAEIAEVLDVPVNTVRTYLHRGRKRLRTLMTDPDDSENGSWQIATPNN